MKGFRAAFYKDMKLLWRGSGLAVLLLPLLLSAAFSLFAADLSDQTGIRPFMIAVRDRDQTLMSGSLISQMRELELFSEVRKVGEDVTDEALLAEGAAAVITIPKDYFYEMYTASDCPVDVTLNESMPLESSVLQSVFVSVMKIISSDQAAQRGAYRFAYGDLDRQLLDRLYEDTSLDLFQDALSRQAVFENTLQASDAAGAMARRLLASVISMLLFILLTGALVTIPEELALGVLPRYRGAGGRIFAFILSRLVCIFLLFNLCLLMTGLGLAGILLLTGHSGDFLSGLVLLTGKASFLSACRQIWLCVLLLAVCLAACLLLVTMLAGTAERARKACNVLLLISLVLGGTLWPCSLLPSPFHLAGRLTMPWYMLLLLEETAAGSSLSAVLPDLMPVLAAGTVCLLLSILYIASSGRIRSNRQQALALANRQAVPVRQTSGFSPPPEEPGRLQSLAGRLAGLTGFKCRIAGGRAMLPLLLLLTVCSLAAGAASGQDSRALRVAVSDLDNSDISAGLTDMIREESRISLSRCSPEEGQRLLMTGSIEGLLVIDEGYGDRMRAYAETDMDQEGSGRAMPLHYYAASSAASAQGVREIAAGQVCAQRSAWRAMRIAGNLRGDPLNEAERQTLLAMIEEEKALLPALYQLHYGSGRPAGIPFLPGAEAFAAMAALMLLMTAGSGCHQRFHPHAASAGRTPAVPWQRSSVTDTDRLYILYDRPAARTAPAGCHIRSPAGLFRGCPSGPGRRLLSVCLLRRCPFPFSGPEESYGRPDRCHGPRPDSPALPDRRLFHGSYLPVERSSFPLPAVSPRPADRRLQRQSRGVRHTGRGRPPAVPAVRAQDTGRIPLTRP